MSKKIISIFIVLAMFSFMGCVFCNASECSDDDCCKVYKPVTIAPNQVAEITPCGRNDCCDFTHSEPKSFKVWAENPLTNFTLQVIKFGKTENIDAIGSCKVNLTSSLPTFKILNNEINLNDTFNGELKMERQSTSGGGKTCLGSCFCHDCPNPDPKPSSATSLSASIGAIFATLLGLLAL